MSKFATVAVLAASLAASLAGAVLTAGSASAETAKPTIVLVHGAFADSSSWNGVTKILQKDGFKVVAAANPLRSVTADAAYVADIVGAIQGPVVLVGHSYGGQVISTAANGHENVKSLVYVAAFAPEEGEAVAELAGKFPGSTLGGALAAPVKLKDGGVDLSIATDEVPPAVRPGCGCRRRRPDGRGQRPITEGALTEKSGKPAWKTVPSYFHRARATVTFRPKALGFMAERAVRSIPSSSIMPRMW